MHCCLPCRMQTAGRRLEPGRKCEYRHVQESARRGRAMTYNIIATGSSGEIWKPVKGFEELYEISSEGRLKSYKRNSSGKMLKLTNQNGDYLRVVLQGVGKQRKSISIHRLVAEHFIPNPDNLPEVNHIDGNKQNNSVGNLEWCSREYNAMHSRKMHPDQLNGMIMFNKYGRPDPILQISKSGEVLRWFPSGAEAARETGICQRNILRVANHTPFKPGHERKTAGGYIWRFEREVMPCEV